jgi:hypothetical protein
MVDKRSMRVADRLAVRDLLQGLELDSPKPEEPLEYCGSVQVKNARDILRGYEAGELVVISRGVLRRVIEALS